MLVSNSLLYSVTNGMYAVLVRSTLSNEKCARGSYAHALVFFLDK
jgi:hypothetical protein